MAITKFKGEVVNLEGNEINVGDKAPVVTAVGTDLRCRNRWRKR